MESITKGLVIVATDAELLNEHYYRRLWIAVRNTQISRREWLDVLADCMRDTHNLDIRYSSGEPYPIPYVDDLMGEDPENRWMSHFLHSDPSGERPYARSRKLERIRLLDLYFRIRHPGIAQHFGN